MQELTLDLRIGETVLVGDYRVTVLDVEGDEVFLRWESVYDDELLTVGAVPLK